jgi:hypothetical protein
MIHAGHRAGLGRAVQGALAGRTCPTNGSHAWRIARDAARCIVRIESVVDLNFTMDVSNIRTHLRLSKSPTHLQTFAWSMPCALGSHGRDKGLTRCSSCQDHGNVLAKRHWFASWQDRKHRYLLTTPQTWAATTTPSHLENRSVIATDSRIFVPGRSAH